MTRQRWCFAVQCWAQLHRDVRGFLGSILNPVMSQQRICLQGAVRPRTHANHMLINIYHYKFYIFIVISQEVLQGKKSLLRSNVSANSKLIFSFFFLSHRAWMFQKSKKKKKVNWSPLSKIETFLYIAQASPLVSFQSFPFISSLL